MYPVELEIKDTTESNTSASDLDLLLSIGRDGQLHTSIYYKRDDFNFHVTTFPFLSSNIPTSPSYGVFISQLIRYARACLMFYPEGDNDNPLLIRLCTELDLLPNFEWFPKNIYDGCGMPTGDAYSSGHLIPSHWDLHMFYLLRPIRFRTCRYFIGICSSNIPRYFFDFA